jgi:hypothetical protein
VSGLREDRDSGYQIRVAGVPLTAYLRHHTTHGDRVTIKIDAEGSEYTILDDLLLHDDLHHRIECLHVEWHCGGADEYVRLFQERGIPLKEWTL